MKKFQITKDELKDWTPRIQMAYSGGVSIWVQVGIVSKVIKYVVTQRNEEEMYFDDIQDAISEFNSRMTWEA